MRSGSTRCWPHAFREARKKGGSRSPRPCRHCWCAPWSGARIEVQREAVFQSLRDFGEFRILDRVERLVRAGLVALTLERDAEHHVRAVRVGHAALCHGLLQRRGSLGVVAGAEVQLADRSRISSPVFAAASCAAAFGSAARSWSRLALGSFERALGAHQVVAREHVRASMPFCMTRSASWPKPPITSACVMSVYWPRLLERARRPPRDDTAPSVRGRAWSA